MLPGGGPDERLSQHPALLAKLQLILNTEKIPFAVTSIIWSTGIPMRTVLLRLF